MVQQVNPRSLIGVEPITTTRLTSPTAKKIPQSRRHFLATLMTKEPRFVATRIWLERDKPARQHDSLDIVRLQPLRCPPHAGSAGDTSSPALEVYGSDHDLGPARQMPNEQGSVGVHVLAQNLEPRRECPNGKFLVVQPQSIADLRGPAVTAQMAHLDDVGVPRGRLLPAEVARAAPRPIRPWIRFARGQRRRPHHGSGGGWVKALHWALAWGDDSLDLLVGSIHPTLDTR